MKVQKLTRCDLGYGDFAYYGEIITKVVGIMNNGYTFTVIDREGEPYQTEVLNPIPITPEILEKNGFKRWENTGLYQYHGSNFDIGYYIGLKRCGIYKSKEYDLEFKKDFIFVHELQHALRLCKIDKEIEL